VAPNAIPVGDAGAYPGQRLGLPAEGRGALASWQQRLTALAVDWLASMVVAIGLFGLGVVNGSGGWRGWMVMAVYFVESTVLCTLAAGSFGQLVTRIAVVRLEAAPLGLLRSAARAALVCVVIPAVVIGADRRGLHDVAVGTVVIRRR